MRIRKARKEDLNTVVELGFELLRHHCRFNRYYTPIENEKKRKRSQKKHYLECIRSRNAFFIVVVDKGKIIGYVIGEIKKNPPVLLEKRHGEIGEIFIQKEYRKEGLGLFLIQEILYWFRKREIERVVVDFDAKNKIARSAYKKMGFKPFKEIYQRQL